MTPTALVPTMIGTRGNAPRGGGSGFETFDAVASRAGAVAGGGVTRSFGISTVFASPSGAMVTVVDHGVAPGARALTVYVPPSMGNARFHTAGSTTTESRATSKPSGDSAGTRIVSFETRASTLFACS